MSFGELQKVNGIGKCASQGIMKKQQGYSSRIVSEGLRSKSNYCHVTIAEARMISSSSQNQEATNATCGLDASSPIALRKRKIIIGESRKYSSRCKNVNETGLSGASVPHDVRGQQKRKRIQSKPTQRGNRSRDMDIEKTDIERIDEVEFKSRRPNSVLKIGVPTRQQNNKGHSAANSWEGLQEVTPSADSYKCSSSVDTSHSSDERGDTQKGSDNEDGDCREIEVERIEEAEFMKSKKNCGVNLDPLICTDSNKGYCVDTCRKNGYNISNLMRSSDFGKSVGLKDNYHGFGQGRQSNSSPIVQISVSDSEDMIPRKIGIEKIDKAKFRNRERHSVSVTGPTSSKNVYGANRNILNADLCTPLFPEDSCNSPLVDKSIPLGKTGVDSEHLTSKQIEIEDIDDFESEDEIVRHATKRGSIFLQGFDEHCFPANSGKNADTGKEDAYSFAEKGNNDEDTDLEKIEVEKINNSMFRKERKRFTASSQGNDTYKMMFPTKKIDENRDGVSTHSGKGKHKHLVGSHDVSSDFVEGMTDSSSECDKADDFVPGNEISLRGSKTTLGVASRTRSKMGTIKQGSEVAVDAFNSFDDSNSSTDSGLDISDDDVFECNDSYDFGCHETELFASDGEDCEIQDDLLMDVSEKSKNCNEQWTSEVKPASKKRHFSHFASNKQTKGGSHGENEEISRIYLDDASDRKGSKQSGNERLNIQKLTHSKHVDPHMNLDEVDGANKMPPTDQLLPCTRKQKKLVSPSHSRDDFDHIAGNKDNDGDDGNDDGEDDIDGKKDEDPRMNVDEVDGANKMPHMDQLLAGIRKQKKPVSSFHSKDYFDQIAGNKDNDGDGGDDDGEDEIDGKKEVHVADQTKKPTNRAQVGAKYYDFCKILEDSVLGRGLKLEPKKCDAEDKQAHAAQAQYALPLKFRFEDDVPKEVEKPEFEKETESLFAELELNWALSVLGSFTYPEADQENVNSPVEETQHARCARGQHELVLEDDEGLFCKYCHHVEHGPRDMMPQWVEKIHYESERKRESEMEKHIDFDALHLQSSMGDCAGLSNCASGTVWNVICGIRESMYEHQQEGFEFLWKNLAGSINVEDLKNPNPSGVGGCIISHAPGTGKTRLTIVFIETYLKLFPHCRPMIIAPASMLLTWEEEFKKWNVEFPFHNLNNLELSGKENNTALEIFAGCKRQDYYAVRMVKIYSWNVGRSILGISYSLFEKLTAQKCITEKTNGNKKGIVSDDKMEPMRKILLEKPGLVVLDEGHTPRNQRSNIWNVLLELQTEKRVILSGTPFQNNFAELLNTLRLVRPAAANALEQEKMFAEIENINARRMSSKKQNGENSQSNVITELVDRAVEKLKISMAPFVHVHKGTILKQNLPGLRDCVVLLKPPVLQKSLLEKLEGFRNTFKLEHDSALLSVHPCLFQYCDSTEEQKNGIDMNEVEASRLNPNEGVKTKFIMEFIHLSMAMNEKVLIFSQYIHPLELLKDQLKEIFGWVEGKQILQMKGKVDQKRRQSLINIFNNPRSESKIMLASTRCCSEGISLVGASRVILLDVLWNPSVERQAICRAYRIGQKKFVHTYHLMTSGTTEADKYCRQAEKERLSELVFSSSSNESSEEKHPSLGIEDRILEELVAHPRSKEIFEKIINQPKDTNLIQTFGLTD